MRLAPVDPRSILQGDYMALNYQLYFSAAVGNTKDDVTSTEVMTMDQLHDRSHILSYVQLDTQRRVMKTSFDVRLLKQYPQQVVKLLLKNPRNTFESLYPAANSYLFAEGLEPCYRNAQYAELKVKHNGQPLLVALVDKNLKSLNCEQPRSWWQPSL